MRALPLAGTAILGLSAAGERAETAPWIATDTRVKDESDRRTEFLDLKEPFEARGCKDREKHSGGERLASPISKEGSMRTNRSLALLLILGVDAGVTIGGCAKKEAALPG